MKLYFDIYEHKELSKAERKEKEKFYSKLFLFNRISDFFAQKADKRHLKILQFIDYSLSDMFFPTFEFRYYGLKLFCGKQGSGKTSGMVYYLDKIKEEYPDCIIVTNFYYHKADYHFNSINDLDNIRNGEKGVVFAIDEIQTLFPSNRSKDYFPFEKLGTICQQRKQWVHIVATAQVFSRVCKELREQTFSVFDCKTYNCRWTFVREYDAVEFEAAQSVVTDFRRKRFFLNNKWSFVQSNAFRKEFDTREVVDNESLRKR